MKTTLNPLKWISYSRMLMEVEESVLFVYGEIASSNIEIASSIALDALARDAISKGFTCEEFAYVLYSMDEGYIAYQTVFSLEMMYGEMPLAEREKLVDKVARIQYKLAEGTFVDEFKSANDEAL